MVFIIFRPSLCTGFENRLFKCFLLILERVEGRRKERDIDARNINHMPPKRPPTGDQAPNLGIGPDGEVDCDLLAQWSMLRH